jgi:hypothetical protein
MGTKNNQTTTDVVLFDFLKKIQFQGDMTIHVSRQTGGDRRRNT